MSPHEEWENSSRWRWRRQARMQAVLYTYFTPKPKPEDKMAHPPHNQVAKENKVHHKQMVQWQQRAQCPATPTIWPQAPPAVKWGRLLPFFILENKLSQLEISQYQSTIMAVCNSGSYLIEEFGCLLFFKLLAGTNKRMHVPIAPFKEHIRFCLTKDYFSNLVDIFMRRQTKTWC